MSEYNFTSCVWWGLIAEIAPRAEEIVGEKEIACCVRGYHIYKNIWAAAILEVLVCSMEPSNIGKFFVVKLYLRRIFRRFSVYENIFTTKTKRITVGIEQFHLVCTFII